MNNAIQHIIYLDLNHIIQMAKDYKIGNTSALDRITVLSNKRNAIFPISLSHLLEISAISKANQRQDLANTIKIVSKGYIIHPLDTMMYREVFNRVAEHYGHRQIIQPEKTFAVGHGFYKALGELHIDFTPWRNFDLERSKLAEQEVWKALNDDSLLDFLVSSYIPKIKPGSEEHKLLITEIEKNRKQNIGKTLAQMEEECVLGLNKKFITLVLQACTEIGLSWTEITSNPPSHFWNKEYMLTLPTIDVWSKMYMYLYMNQQTKVKVNHIYDLSHISVAIPYADIVVSDKEMVHVVSIHKLDKRYNSVVFSKLEDGLNYLESIIK